MYARILVVTACILAASCARKMPLTPETMAVAVEAMLFAAVQQGCSSPRLLFRTTSTWTGAAIGGISGADAKCNADAAKPAGTYKAVLVDASGSRTACTTANCSGGAEGTGWALAPNCSYTRADGTPVFTTASSGVFPFGSFTNPIESSGSGFWTGLLSNWTLDSTNRCNNWGAGGGSGAYGMSGQTGTGAIATGINSCNAPLLSLLCAQQ